jgi:hypothetical protein
VRRLHLPRDLIVALLGRLADELALPHELVPVDATGASLTALLASTVRSELALSTPVDHRSVLLGRCPSGRSLFPPPFRPSSWLLFDVVDLCKPSFLPAMKSLFSYFPALFVPVLERILAASVIRAEITAKFLRLADL